MHDKVAGFQQRLSVSLNAFKSDVVNQLVGLQDDCLVRARQLRSPLPASLQKSTIGRPSLAQLLRWIPQVTAAFCSLVAKGSLALDMMDSVEDEHNDGEDDESDAIFGHVITDSQPSSGPERVGQLKLAASAPAPPEFLTAKGSMLASAFILPIQQRDLIQGKTPPHHRLFISLFICALFRNILR